MDNKKLPQEVMNEIALADCQKQVSVKYGLGTTLVTGHKAAYFNEATEMLLSQKDTTIKELQAKNEKLTGLLLRVYREAYGVEKLNDFKQQYGIEP